MTDTAYANWDMSKRPWISHERFWLKVSPPNVNGCRTWMGTVRLGYGRVRREGVLIPAHRFAWELKHGKVPAGLQLDHYRMNEELMSGEERLCSRSCVEHLRLVTSRENTLASPKVRAMLAALHAKARNKTHCLRGHHYDAQNTYIAKSGGRYCRTCHREYQLRLYHRKRQAEKGGAPS